MDDDILRQVERFLRENDAQTHPAIRDWNAFVEQLRRLMPHGREGLVVLPPDPNDLGLSLPWHAGSFWAIGVGTYSYVPETGQHVITPLPPPEVAELTDEEREAGMIQIDLTPMPGYVGLEDFDSMEELLDEVYTRLKYCTTERPFSYQELPLEPELIKYYILRAAELTVKLQQSMPQFTRDTLARWAMHAYDEIVPNDEGDTTE
jgi:hypothetical protein